LPFGESFSSVKFSLTGTILSRLFRPSTATCTGTFAGSPPGWSV
jgi:hypothetical protein